MPAPSTIPEFLELVRRSGVLEDERLDAYVAQNSPGSATPTRFAGQLVRDGLLTKFQAEQFLAGKWKRFSIGKYKVLERLGQGGMGQVFLCEHRLMRRRVAVKVLPTAKAEDPAALERFYREARAVAALDHPNLVRAFDIDEDNQLHFLVMEFVDGSSFYDIVKKHGPMDPTRAAHYLHQAAIGLDYANQVAGIVHRDIKPGNILVDRLGVVKILDMGLARFFNDESDVLTRKYDESVLGTADYLAPEQAIDSHSVDIRADIYSLGATFYFVLAGKPPFPDGTVPQKLIWHQSKNPTSLHEVRPGLPPELVRIIEKMMKKDKNERYTTPAELAEALMPLTSEPIPPPPEAEMPQLSLAAMAGVSAMPANPRAVAARLPGGVRVGAATGSSGQLSRPPVSGFTPHTPLPRPGASVTPSPGPGETVANPFNSALVGAGTRGERGILESVYAARPQVQSDEAAATDDDRLSKVWFGLGIVCLVAAAAMGAWWFNSRESSSNSSQLPERTKPANVATGTAIVVNPLGGGDCKTLFDAIRLARSGDRIVIKSPVIQEVFQLDGRSLARANITIESGRADGLPVVWTPPAAVSTSTQLLELTAVEGLTIRNIVFDGQGRLETVLRVTGQCPGFTCDQVQVRGFTKAGVRLQDAAGQTDRPLVLTGCRIQGGPNAESALRVQGGSGARSLRDVRITDCILDGPYQQAAILGDGNATDVLFERIRVFRAVDGLRWRKHEPDQIVRVRLSLSTIAEMKSAAVQVEPGALGSGSNLQLERVLVVKCGTVMSASGVQDQITASEIGRDTITADGDLPATARQEARVDFLSTDPASRDFLRYSRSSRWASAGSNGKPIGAPPE